jgi:hypothetical protein
MKIRRTVIATERAGNVIIMDFILSVEFSVHIEESKLEEEMKAVSQVETWL